MADTQNKKLIFYGVAALFVLFLIVWTATGNMDGPFSIDGLGMWLAAFLSICILSFLYDDNSIYKFAEHLFIGVSAAYYMVLAVWDEIIKHLMIKLWPELIAWAGLVEGVDTDEEGLALGYDNRPALITPDGKLIEWMSLSVGKLCEALRTHKPVCWRCLVAETLRRKHRGAGVGQD